MGFLNWLTATATETKSDTTPLTVPANATPAQIRLDIAGGYGDLSGASWEVATFWACARVIAEDLAKVPALIQRRSRDGGHEYATDHPLFRLFATAPNSYQSSFDLREWIGFQLALEGNAYLYLSRDTRGRVIELLPLPHGSVTVENPTLGEVRYRIGTIDDRLYDQTNVWHIKAASRQSITGDNPRFIAARSLALSQALETFGMNLFLNGSRPSGILTTDQPLKPEEYATIIGAWNARNAGVENAHRTALLSNGLKFQAMQTQANDAQFIEARRYQTEEICRLMRVDPLMIQQATTSAAYASVEQRFLAHAQNTLEPIYVRFEQSANRALFTPAEQAQGYRLHLDRRSLTRGSANDRAMYYGQMKQNGLMTTNEIRDAEGLDRFYDPEADKLMPAANLYGPQTADTAK